MESRRLHFDKDKDKYVKVTLDQSFKTLEILSLKIDISDLYPMYLASYGCVAGRITSNNGFGLSNVKLSIFIPSVEIDQNLKSLYPYVTPYSKKGNIRYNLFPTAKQSEFHTPIGSFNSKPELLDNLTEIEIFEKYYKYTTATNDAGDFIIMGVPVGNRQIHMDCDLSDISYFSVRPYDMIAAGYSEKMFVNSVRFKGGEDLDRLAQVISLNTSINVLPFWGDNGLTDVGFTMFKYDIPYTIIPHAVVFGSLFTENNKGSIRKNCRPTDTGLNCKLAPFTANIEVLSQNEDGSNTLLQLNTSEVDADGNFVLLVPMTNNKVITDNNGMLVPSLNNDGIPTTNKIRLKISNSDSSYSFWQGSTKTASFLVPNLYNNFEFDETTKTIDFFDIKWKKYYTVSQYIPRFQRSDNPTTKIFLGFSDIGNCDNVNSIPYNRLDDEFSIIYTVLYIITTVIVKILNALSHIFIHPTLKCGNSDAEYDNSGPGRQYDDWQQCVMSQLAEETGSVKYQFFNDWINGSLYFPKFAYNVKYKDNRVYKERFCDYNCRSFGATVPSDSTYNNYCFEPFIVDKKNFNNGIDFIINMANKPHGLIYKKNEELFYASRWDDTKSELTVNTKGNLLMATNLVELGSLEKRDFHNKPQIIQKFNASTYIHPDVTDGLYSLSALQVDHVHSNGISLASQIKINGLSADDDLSYHGPFNRLPDFGYDINPDANRFVVFDRIDTALRKYLCENFKFYSQTFTYESKIVDANSPAYLLETDGTVYPVTTDKCLGCDDQLTPAFRMHPYYFYFGVVPNRTAIDLIKRKYV